MGFRINFFRFYPKLLYDIIIVESVSVVLGISSYFPPFFILTLMLKESQIHPHSTIIKGTETIYHEKSIISLQGGNELVKQKNDFKENIQEKLFQITVLRW